MIHGKRERPQLERRITIGDEVNRIFLLLKDWGLAQYIGVYGDPTSKGRTQAAREASKEVDTKYVHDAADAADTIGKRALPMK